MIVWLVGAGLTALSLAVMTRPFWHRDDETATRADFDIAVYKDQLGELDRDEKRGLISEEEARQARLEIQRRLLNADQQRQSQQKQRSRLGWGGRAAWFVLFIGVAGGTFTLYRDLGAPLEPDLPFASRDLDAERAELRASRDMSKQIAAIEEHLAEQPNDAQAWVMLGRANRIQGAFQASLDAFDRALTLTNRQPEIVIDYVESAVALQDGPVSEELYAWVEEAIAENPFLFKARFFKGYIQARNEHYAGAIQTWMDLMVMSPSGAPWIGQVQQYLREAAQVSGFDPSNFEPSDEAKYLAEQVKNRQQAPQPSGPSAEDIAAAQEMTAEEQQAMIASMVARLEERMADNPEDLVGWQRLLQAYQVLGRTEDALEVENKIKALTQ